MKLLLVDDDPVSRSALRDVIGPPIGWELVELDDPCRALAELLKGMKPDLCIVDLLMPQMSGTQFLEAVRGDPYLQALRVVVTSASRDRDTILALAKLQVSGYLLKPYDATKTRAALQPLMTTTSTAGASIQVKKSDKRTLLAVDDDPVMRAVITAMVANDTNWEVRFAVNGEDAFDNLYGGLRPDLIITDLNMPKVDGFALIQRIRKDRNFEGMKVAVLSGDKDTERVRQLAGLNVYAYIAKPIDQKQMQSLLSRAAS